MTDNPRTSFLTKAGFPPIIDETSRVLVLGTLPSEESFRRREYYGHPRNQFWRILANIYHVPLVETYPERVALLRQKQLALWDVLQRGERQGSLDQAIRHAVPNDFRELPRLLMPSTSPAATMPLTEKIKRWSQIIEL
jgi:TDG/mug DNA glycosylase family protein